MGKRYYVNGKLFDEDEGEFIDEGSRYPPPPRSIEPYMPSPPLPSNNSPTTNFSRRSRIFSIGYAFLGLICGGIYGVLPGLLIALIIDNRNTVPFMVSIIVCAVIGFICDGIESVREEFSIHRSFWGIICGFIFGVGMSVGLAFTSGCLVIIGVLLLPAVAGVIATIIIIYYTIRGFIKYGRGGTWDDL